MITRRKTRRIAPGSGEVIRKVPESEIVQAMREEVDRFIAERKAAQAAVAGGN
jgi:hypothetical protein